MDIRVLSSEPERCNIYIPPIAAMRHHAGSAKQSCLHSRVAVMPTFTVCRSTGHEVALLYCASARPSPAKNPLLAAPCLSPLHSQLRQIACRRHVGELVLPILTAGIPRHSEMLAVHAICLQEHKRAYDKVHRDYDVTTDAKRCHIGYRVSNASSFPTLTYRLHLQAAHNFMVVRADLASIGISPP